MEELNDQNCNKIKIKSLRVQFTSENWKSEGGWDYVKHRNCSVTIADLYKC